jgi:hypothetical protein
MTEVLGPNDRCYTVSFITIIERLLLTTCFVFLNPVHHSNRCMINLAQGEDKCIGTEPCVQSIAKSNSHKI